MQFLVIILVSPRKSEDVTVCVCECRRDHWCDSGEAYCPVTFKSCGLLRCWAQRHWLMNDPQASRRGARWVCELHHTEPIIVHHRRATGIHTCHCRIRFKQQILYWLWNGKLLTSVNYHAGFVIYSCAWTLALNHLCEIQLQHSVNMHVYVHTATDGRGQQEQPHTSDQSCFLAVVSQKDMKSNSGVTPVLHYVSLD